LVPGPEAIKEAPCAGRAVKKSKEQTESSKIVRDLMFEEANGLLKRQKILWRAGRVEEK
jgi:hypothetical protein